MPPLRVFHHMMHILVRPTISEPSEARSELTEENTEREVTYELKPSPERKPAFRYIPKSRRKPDLPAFITSLSPNQNQKPIYYHKIEPSVAQEETEV